MESSPPSAQRVSIMTPCCNAERYIADTVAPIVEQMTVVRDPIELACLPRIRFLCDGAGTSLKGPMLVSAGAGIVRRAAIRWIFCSAECRCHSRTHHSQ